MDKKTSFAVSEWVAGTVKEMTRMPVSEVEEAIDKIAHCQGDELAKMIVSQLSPVKIAAILRQHDFSCPSIVSWLLSPGVIVEILKCDPLFWQRTCEKNRPQTFDKIREDALDLLCSILANASSRNKQGQILALIMSDDTSRMYLFLAFIGHHIEEEQKQLFETADIDTGTFDHLFEMIRWAAPEAAWLILEFIHSGSTSLVPFIMDLRSEAFDFFSEPFSYRHIEDVMFLPVE